jgi:hypothetical protein
MNSRVESPKIKNAQRQAAGSSKLTTCKVDLSLRMSKAPTLAALIWSLKAGLENKLSILEAGG